MKLDTGIQGTQSTVKVLLHFNSMKRHCVLVQLALAADSLLSNL
jgi:hypothetical protein